MTASTSIFRYIIEHMEGDRLSDSASLSGFKGKDAGVPFADGAMDGISLYHSAGASFPDDIMDLIQQALVPIFSEDQETADARLAELAHEFLAVNLIDPLQHCLLERFEDADGIILLQYAWHLMVDSDDKELVKVGLSLLEMFPDPPEEIRNCACILGLSDEFSVFVLWNMRRWPDANQQVFDLAQKVKGWGRVHAVELLEPDTPEIKDWLLKEGAHNQVLPEYSALTCYYGADVPGRLEGELSEEDFHAISFILAAMLEEGPVVGISALEDPVASLLLYVSQAERQPLLPEDLETIQAIRDYANGKKAKELSKRCSALIPAD